MSRLIGSCLEKHSALLEFRGRLAEAVPGRSAARSLMIVPASAPLLNQEVTHTWLILSQH